MYKQFKNFKILNRGGVNRIAWCLHLAIYSISHSFSCTWIHVKQTRASSLKQCTIDGILRRLCIKENVQFHTIGKKHLTMCEPSGSPRHLVQRCSRDSRQRQYAQPCTSHPWTMSHGRLLCLHIGYRLSGSGECVGPATSWKPWPFEGVFLWRSCRQSVDVRILGQ